jgi:hypothetical protein
LFACENAQKKSDRRQKKKKKIEHKAIEDDDGGDDDDVVDVDGQSAQTNVSFGGEQPIGMNRMNKTR